MNTVDGHSPEEHQITPFSIQCKRALSSPVDFAQHLDDVRCFILWSFKAVQKRKTEFYRDETWRCTHDVLVVLLRFGLLPRFSQCKSN